MFCLIYSYKYSCYICLFLSKHCNSCPLCVTVAGYLCKPEDNIYNIDFVRFKIRDLETNTVLFEIAKPPHSGTIFHCSLHCSISVWFHLKIDGLAPLTAITRSQPVWKFNPKPVYYAANCVVFAVRRR